MAAEIWKIAAEKLRGKVAANLYEQWIANLKPLYLDDACLVLGVANDFLGEWVENSRGLRIRDKIFLEWGDRFDWPDENAPLGDENVFCYGLKDQFGILCDGTVVPCCLDSEGVISLGNLFTQALSRILQSPRATAIREGFRCRKATEDLCRRCGYARKF